MGWAKAIGVLAGIDIFLLALSYVASWAGVTLPWPITLIDIVFLFFPLRLLEFALYAWALWLAPLMVWTGYKVLFKRRRRSEDEPESIVSSSFLSGAERSQETVLAALELTGSTQRSDREPGE